MKAEEIISDDEIIRVHAYANFGGLTPREVVNDGVRKYAVGYTGGATQLAILWEHGLIKRPMGTSYKADLTEKGKKYARSIYSNPQSDFAAIREAALRDALDAVSRAAWKHNGDDSYSAGLEDGARNQNEADYDAILAIIGEKK